MHCNILLNDNKSIPQTILNSLVVEIKFNPIHGKVLIAYFVEINQQSDSFPLLTIIKTNKTKTLFSVFSIEYIFLPQGD